MGHRGGAQTCGTVPKLAGSMGDGVSGHGELLLRSLPAVNAEMVCTNEAEQAAGPCSGLQWSACPFKFSLHFLKLASSHDQDSVSRPSRGGGD